MSTRKAQVNSVAEDSADIVVPLALPRSALTIVAPPPEFLSQRNVEAVTGVPKRQYLEALPAFRRAGGVVSSLGKLRLVDRAAFAAWLRGPACAWTAVSNDTNKEPTLAEGVDDVLKSWGLVAQKGRAS